MLAVGCQAQAEGMIERQIKRANLSPLGDVPKPQFALAGIVLNQKKKNAAVVAKVVLLKLAPKGVSISKRSFLLFPTSKQRRWPESFSISSFLFFCCKWACAIRNLPSPLGRQKDEVLILSDHFRAPQPMQAVAGGTVKYRVIEILKRIGKEQSGAADTSECFGFHGIAKKH